MVPQQLLVKLDILWLCVQGVARVVEHLGKHKHGHAVVVWVNLRQDPVLDCDGATYSWRDAAHPDQPQIVPGVKGAVIEVSTKPVVNLLLKAPTCVASRVNAALKIRVFIMLLTPFDRTWKCCSRMSS